MKKEKKLFECEYSFNYEELKKFYNIFKLSYYRNVIPIIGLLIFIILLVAVINNYSIYFVTVLTLVIISFITLVRSSKRNEKMTKEYNKQRTKGIITNIKFYETYLVRENEYNKITIFYDDINRIVETKDNFYMSYDNYYIFQKNKMSDELIEFIQNLKVKRYIDYSNGKKKNKIVDYEFINSLIYTINLFNLIISILFFANKNFNNKILMCLFLIIPIINLILSIIYRKKIKKKVNILFSLLCIYLIVIMTIKVLF